MSNNTTKATRQGGYLALMLAFALMFVSSGSASAQRTMLGQYFGTVSYERTVTSLTNNRVIDVYSGSFGQYMLNWYWSAGVSYGKMQGFDHKGRFLANGGAMYRFAETRSRFLNLYAGGDLIIGYDMGGKSLDQVLNAGKESSSGEVVYDGGTSIDDIFGKSDAVIARETEYLDAGFTYGLVPRLEAEVFVFRKLCLVLGVKAPVTAISFKDDDSGTVETSVIVDIRPLVGLRLNF